MLLTFSAIHLPYVMSVKNTYNWYLKESQSNDTPPFSWSTCVDWLGLFMARPEPMFVCLIYRGRTFVLPQTLNGHLEDRKEQLAEFDKKCMGLKSQTAFCISQGRRNKLRHTESSWHFGDQIRNNVCGKDGWSPYWKQKQHHGCLNQWPYLCSQAYGNPSSMKWPLCADGAS